MRVWDQIKSIFQSAEDSKASAPALHEVLSRHIEEAEAFARWREGLVRRRLTDWLSDQYALYLSEPNRVDKSLDFLKTKSQKGFVIHFSDTQYSLREAEFFHLYLRERVLTQAYRTQVADARTYSQQFGNVMIELVVRNETPHQLKFSAAIYHDRVYKDAAGFGALMDIVLS